MPLATTLNTNEVKNAAGTEVEFQTSDTEGRIHEYAALSEPPNMKHRLKVSHQETGTGIETVRRSVCRVDKTIAGVSGKPRTISSYQVDIIPVGDLANYDEVKNVNAELGSFIYTTGGTTFLYDGTGNGASALIAGTT